VHCNLRLVDSIEEIGHSDANIDSSSDDVEDSLADIKAALNFYISRSAKLPTRLYILLALISSFFFFFNDQSEKNYLRIYWTNFRNLCTK